MKDNFSHRSADYAQFRPSYPAALYEFIVANCAGNDCAWDCATGNGQVAVVLADHFRQVEATDISENQLKNAAFRPNIHYQMAAAEQSVFSENQFDLVTVGQAAHWFRLEKFYTEVQRVLKPGGLLALFGYGLLHIDAPTDAVVEHLYHDILGDDWDPERQLVDEALATIAFPFREIPLPEMVVEYRWTTDFLLGYLSTWSAVRHYEKRTGESPLGESFAAALSAAWGAEAEKTVRFSIFGRVGVHQ
ncbi:MAG: class I SAM-dependent methyltransferase [Saprospiraceae bacterium]